MSELCGSINSADVLFEFDHDHERVLFGSDEIQFDGTEVDATQASEIGEPSCSFRLQQFSPPSSPCGSSPERSPTRSSIRKSRRIAARVPDTNRRTRKRSASSVVSKESEDRVHSGPVPLMRTVDINSSDTNDISVSPSPQYNDPHDVSAINTNCFIAALEEQRMADADRTNDTLYSICEQQRDFAEQLAEIRSSICTTSFSHEREKILRCQDALREMFKCMCEERRQAWSDIRKLTRINNELANRNRELAGHLVSMAKSVMVYTQPISPVLSQPKCSIPAHLLCTESEL